MSSNLARFVAFALVSLVMVGCGKGNGDKDKVYDIKGKVVAVDADKKKVTLDHEAIPGLMKAMEMPFAVENTGILEGIKPGDKVRGKLKVDSANNMTITQLEKAGDSSSLKQEGDVLLCCHACENHALADADPALGLENLQRTKDSKVKKLLTERLATLRELVKVTDAEYRVGKASFDRVQQAQRALLNARIELCESDKERIMVLEDMVSLAREHEKIAAQRYKTGVATQSDVLLATAARLEVEITLERIRAKVPNPGK